jgi:hypothetical protein
VLKKAEAVDGGVFGEGRFKGEEVETQKPHLYGVG